MPKWKGIFYNGASLSLHRLQPALVHNDDDNNNDDDDEDDDDDDALENIRGQDSGLRLRRRGRGVARESVRVSGSAAHNAQNTLKTTVENTSDSTRNFL